MKTTFFTEFIDAANDIEIPLLQRDYVQGGNTIIISEFIESIIDAFKKETILDLNYIYGMWGKKGYIPIDGQQRLITLWLLHLYVWTRNNNSSKTAFPVRLKFMSREAADNFSEKLSLHIKDCINDDNHSIKYKIENSSWFSLTWEKDRTVRSMLNMLNVLDKQCTAKKINMEKFYDSLSNGLISFMFYPVENDISDDIYIKMNGRGLPLTYFDLLKSWIDGHIETILKNKDLVLSEDDRNVISAWPDKIDNDWTQLLWKNRNLYEVDENKKDISFRIDDEQMRIIYSLAILYWVRKDEEELLHLKDLDEEERDFRFNEICNFLGIKDENKDESTVKKCILDKFFQKNNYWIPLYLLDKFNLFSANFIVKMSEWLDSLYNYQEQKSILFKHDENKVNFRLNPDEHKTLFHQIALDEEPTYERLLILYSSLIYDTISKTTFYDWMRIVRNLVHNSTLSKDTFTDILSSLDILSDICKTTDVIDYFVETQKISLKGISPRQISEEQWKAELIQHDDNWRDLISELENHPFFMGDISFVRLYLEDGINKNDFAKVSNIFRNLFDKDNIRREFANGILHRALMASTVDSYGFGYEGTNFCMISSKEDWKKIVSDTDVINSEVPHAANDSIKKVINIIINQLDSENYNWETELASEVLSNLLRNIYKQEIKQPTITDWRRFFIHYNIWPKMWEKHIHWNGELDILLLNKTKNKEGGIYELRTACFHTIIEEYWKNLHFRNNWDGPHAYKHGRTIAYFFKYRMNMLTIAIDVFFGRKVEDDYQLSIYYPKHKNEGFETEVLYQSTRNDFKVLDDIFPDWLYFDEEKGAYTSRHGISLDMMLKRFKYITEVF